MIFRLMSLFTLAAILGGCIPTPEDANGDGNGTPASLVSKSVPQASISVDGVIADWAGIEPMITDSLGDASYSGLDIDKVFVAQDDSYIFVRLDRGGSSLPANEFSNFWIYLRPAVAGHKGYAVEFFHTDPTTREARLWDISAQPDNYSSYAQLTNTLVNAFSTSVEFAIPKNMITMEDAFHLSFFTHHTVSYEWRNNGDNSASEVKLNFATTTLGLPDKFSMQWLAGRTLYQVWFGLGTDANGNPIDNVPVVAKGVFGADGNVTVTGLLNSRSVTVAYGVDAGGSLYFGGDTTSLNTIVPGGTADYIKTHYSVNGVLDNVDLFFFDENRALAYAAGLTASIP